MARFRFCSCLRLLILLGFFGLALGAPSEAAPFAAPVWNRSIFGTAIGLSGLTIADLDGKPGAEILAGAARGGFGPNTFWYVLRWNGTEYRQIWTSPYAESALGALAVAQLDGDRALEILVARGREIRIYDGATLRSTRTLRIPTGEIQGLAVGDLDRDGKLELVACDAGNLFDLSLATGAIRWRIDGLGGTSLAVGNVDADPALEVVVAGADGYVVDGATHQVQWSHPDGFGSIVRLADLVGGPTAEIVAAVRYEAGIRVYDAMARSLVWAHPDFEVGALAIGDVDGDGASEVVYSGIQEGQIRVLSGASGTEKWSAYSPDGGASGIALGDPDRDGKLEIAWAAGYNSTGPDNLYVLDVASRQREWQSLDFNGPFLGFDFGDVDADGRPEFLYSCQETDSGYSDGLWFVHDARSHALEFQSPPPTGLHWAGSVRLASANVDADPQREIFVTTSHLYTGKLLAYDGKTHQVEWQNEIEDGLTFRALALADVDLDGRLELVASVGVEHTGAPGIFVYVFDAQTGGREWRSPNLSEFTFGDLSPLRVAQLDADPQPEIVVAESDGSIHVLDAVKRTEEAVTDELGVTAFDTRDLNADGKDELIAAIYDSSESVASLHLIDLSTGRLGTRIAGFPARVDALRAQDLTADGKPDFVLGWGGRLHVLDGANGAEIWKSALLGENVGSEDGLLLGDFDGDGRTEIAVSNGSASLSVFELQR